MSFDRIAPFYLTLETLVFGRALQNARTAFLPEMKLRRRALILGEGNGRFLEALLQSDAGVHVDCVDSSAELLRLARGRITDPEQLNRIQFIHSDASKWRPFARYDLIVTNFFLDCFDERQLREIVANISTAAVENARWIVADFVIPADGVWRLVGRLLVRAMYAFFRWTTGLRATRLIDYRGLLEHEGFRRIECREFLCGIVRAELWVGAFPERPTASPRVRV